MKLSSQKHIRTVHAEVATAMNKRLNFADQFNSFVVTVTVDAGEEVTIANQLRNKSGALIIPGSWQVIDARGAGKESLGRSATNEWTKEKIFVENFAVRNGSFRIRFFEQSSDETQFIEQPNPTTAAPDKTTFNVFLGNTSGTETINNGTFTTFTMPSATFFVGNEIVVASDSLTFPYTGKYLAFLQIAKLSSASALSVYGRIRNTTDGITVGLTCPLRSNTIQTEPCAEVEFSVVDASKSYQIQWVANGAGVTLAAPSTIDGETGNQWRYVLERIGDL